MKIRNCVPLVFSLFILSNPASSAYTKKETDDTKENQDSEPFIQFTPANTFLGMSMVLGLCKLGSILKEKISEAFRPEADPEEPKDLKGNSGSKRHNRFPSPKRFEIQHLKTPMLEIKPTVIVQEAVFVAKSETVVERQIRRVNTGMKRFDLDAIKLAVQEMLQFSYSDLPNETQGHINALINRLIKQKDDCKYDDTCKKKIAMFAQQLMTWRSKIGR